MLRKNRLFTPGPTPLLPSAQMAMASATMHHRTADFKALYTAALAGLKEFIGTNNDVVLLTASGTGAMEAAVSNLTSPGDKVLVITAGKFGERWVDLAKAFGCEPVIVRGNYGETVTMSDVKAKLTPDVKCVYMQATETSTGVRHDVEGVAKLVRGSDALLVVDAITGLGTTHFDVDGWEIDVIIGGSQKALMIPPGLAYAAVSMRAWQRMETAKNPRYYFDLRKERKAGAKGEAAFTPSTALVAALVAALEEIKKQGGRSIANGRHELIQNAETCAEMTRAGVEAMGLKLFAPHAPAAAVTAIVPPEGIDSGVIVKGLREMFDAVIANGQGEMKGQIFRVAHLGLYDYMDTLALLGGLEHVLAHAMRPKHFEFGKGLRAAQSVFARHAFSQKAGANA